MFLDAANLTLLALNRELRRPIASPFTDPRQFSAHADGEARLRTLDALANKATAIATAVSEPEVIGRYEAFADELSGGTVPLKFGRGRWLERMSGKEIFRSIAGVAFKVTARDGTVLQGKEQHHQIAKDMLTRPLAAQPADFQSLVSLLRARVR